MDIRNKIVELIERGEAIDRKYRINYLMNKTDGGSSTLSYSRVLELEPWLGEIELLNGKYLKDHSFHKNIHSTYFHRSADKVKTYNEMMGYLRALLTDEDIANQNQSDILNQKQLLIEKSDVESDEYYNLFVLPNQEAYQGNRFKIEIDRALTAYISDNVKSLFSDLNNETLSLVKTFPCLFCYENDLKNNPIQEAYLGYLTDVKIRDNGISFYFQKKSLIPQASILQNLSNLAIDKFEMTRTHWTIKNVNLIEELSDNGLVISNAVPEAIDINTHIFDIAVTFAGENRTLVKEVVDCLTQTIASNRIFYDNLYEAFLARPELDTLLQGIYRNRSKLIVVFLSEAYDKKEWCGLEFHAIRDIIKHKENDKIMYIRVDDADVNGVFSTDGYIDANSHTPKEIAGFVLQRLDPLLSEKEMATL